MSLFITGILRRLVSLNVGSSTRLSGCVRTISHRRGLESRRPQSQGRLRKTEYVLDTPTQVTCLGACSEITESAFCPSFNSLEALFLHLGYVGTEGTQTDGLCVCRSIPSQF